jgi:xylan 1,4-beta-xylosidase
VRWGMAPEKLYSSWMVYGETDLELRALNRHGAVWLAVDAFGEGGVTAGSPQKL